MKNNVHNYITEGSILRPKCDYYIINWRPISLLNVGLEIASKALACRLKKLLKKL